MSIAHPELTAAAPGNGRLEKDGTRQQGLANDASGRKYFATVAVCSATLPRKSPSRTLRISCSRDVPMGISGWSLVAVGELVGAGPEQMRGGVAAGAF